MKSKTLLALVVAIAVAAGATWFLDLGHMVTGGHSRAVDQLISRNVDARGGADAWRAVSTLRLAGQMDLGRGLYVPYTLEQKRPGQMCLEFEFDDELATQCVANGAGWKRLPFRGRRLPEPMTEKELLDLSDTASIDGLLFDSARRGHEIELLGHETLDGRDTIKLEVDLPTGAKRWVYLDAETALEIRVDATRILDGEERLVETYYSDWRDTDGLRIARRLETRTEGVPGSHFVTIDDVTVNPAIADERFQNPAILNADADSDAGNDGSGAS